MDNLPDGVAVVQVFLLHKLRLVVEVFYFMKIRIEFADHATSQAAFFSCRGAPLSPLAQKRFDHSRIELASPGSKSNGILSVLVHGYALGLAFASALPILC